jgi:putative endonuclease
MTWFVEIFEHRSEFVDGLIRDALQCEHNAELWPSAWKIQTVVTANTDWDDLFDTMVKQDVDGRA